MDETTEWKLVPLEPTPEMLRVWKTMFGYSRYQKYKAMLAAAPNVLGSPVARVKTIGGYPDGPEHIVEWLCRFRDLKHGDYLYVAPASVAGLVEALEEARLTLHVMQGRGSSVELTLAIIDRALATHRERGAE